MKNIIISGATGFIGSHLSQHLKTKGFNVVPISRKEFKMQPKAFLDFLSGADAVINLAGAPIVKRWTKKYKNELIASRLFTTRKLAQSIALMPDKPAIFISVSAVGIYDDKGIKKENDNITAEHFLSRLCVDWEHEALAAAAHTKVAICRMGLVLGHNGGLVKKLMPVFKKGLGGPIGSGKQVLSWIHIEDVVQAFVHVLENKLDGVINFTAPYPVSNKEFTKAFARVLKKPAFFMVPSFLLRMVFGEAAFVLTHGQNVYPQRLIESAYEFQFAHIDNALSEAAKQEMPPHTGKTS